ncbi:MAG: HD-GYP domain-containing protein [Lachnospiraceae bacterium]|nr:HD-GYP domain-containing protein [Lachnospiraceae bacterium]
MTKQSIATKKLIPGMKLANSVYNNADQLILPKGSRITEESITRLQFYEIDRVLIESLVPIEPSDEDIFRTTYSERVKASEEFINFKKQFDNTIEITKSTLDEVAAGNSSPELIEQIFSSATSLINTSENNLELLDMLHSMRDSDDVTYTHSLNVSIISAIIGRWLHLSEEDLNTLTIAALFHDIGKLLIPPEILQKTSKLTAEEYELLKTHPYKGYQLLKGFGMDEKIALAAMQHHERCDGSGYPGRLTKNNINSFAKIIAIADVYDAMTAARAYRGPLCTFEVLSTFEKEGYRCYDASYLVPFMHNIVNSYINNTVRLNNGEKGSIIMINKTALSRPIVHCEGQIYHDLLHEKNLKIVAIL